MNDNTTLAIRIAAGVIIGVLFIALMLRVKDEMAAPIRNEQQLKYEQQKQAYNKSFEAYNKALLSGSDLLTVLNKAYENNRQIGKFETGVGLNPFGRDREQYTIAEKVNISLILKSGDLSHNISIEGIDKSGNVKKAGASYIEFGKPLREILGIPQSTVNLMTGSLRYAMNSDTWNDALNQTYPYDSIRGGQKYWLEDFGSNWASVTTVLHEYLQIGAFPIYTARNPDTSKAGDILRNSPISNIVWTYIQYKTPTDDLLTRHFACTNIEYDTESGLVNILEFEELSN